MAGADDIDDGSGLYSRLLEWTNTVFCYYAARGDLKLGLIAQNMKEMLEAGVHYGHQARRWNPKMRNYIFGERNGVHIIGVHLHFFLCAECMLMPRSEALHT